MAAAAVLTIEPARGGVPVMASVMYQRLVTSGHRPQLVYVDAESAPARTQDVPGYLLRRWRAEPQQQREMDSIAVPRYPLPDYAHHFTPGLVAHRAISTPIRVLAAGSGHTGAPWLRDDAPFLAWVASHYGDELSARVQSGDAWAKSVLDGPWWSRMQRLEGRVLRQAARILAISPHTARRLAEEWPELADKLHTVFIPVDVNRLAQRRNAATAAESPYILTTGRIIDPRKNMGMLFRAFARLRGEFPLLRLKLAGMDPNDYVLDAQAAAGVRDGVDYLGRLAYDALVDLIQGASVFALTSNQEGLAITVLEAMAAAVPVVATRCGGPEGTVSDGQTGFLVNVNDDGAFADQTARLLREPGLHAKIGAAAQAHARQHFSPRAIQAQLLTHLRAIYPQHFADDQIAR